MIRDHLGDAEVEDLELRASVRVGDEDVRRIEVAVHDSLRVREGHRVGHGIEQAQHLLNGPPLFAALAARAELLGEGVTLEPLEHHVRHERADRGRHRRARGDGAGDVERASRQAIMDLALVAKAPDERLDERRPELRLELEALDGDRLVEPDVLAPVDDAEPALSDDTIHPELSVENLPHQAVDVLRSHGRDYTQVGALGDPQQDGGGRKLGRSTLNWAAMRTGCEEGRWLFASDLVTVRDMSDEGGSADLAERATRLASAGAVGASVAHELRNALAVAESSLFLARRDLEDRDKLVRHLDKVTVEIRRAQRVIGAVLGLARGETVTLEPADVASLVDGARRAVVLPTNVTFSVSIEPSDLVIRCDAVLLERVLANLYLNAIDALATRGRGAVATHVWRGTDRVNVAVDDDGPGIQPDVARRIFDPLFTTKATGMGLGLALCREVVHAHGGEISATQAPGGGARFAFWIPF
jgi:nitrogen-specific signal transduction histidine kinase